MKKDSQIGAHVESQVDGTGPAQYSMLLPQQLDATDPISIISPPQAACSWRRSAPPPAAAASSAGSTTSWPKRLRVLVGTCGVAEARPAAHSTAAPVRIIFGTGRSPPPAEERTLDGRGGEATG